MFTKEQQSVIEAIRLLTFEGARLPYPECDVLLNAAEYLQIGIEAYWLTQLGETVSSVSHLEWHQAHCD